MVQNHRQQIFTTFQAISTEIHLKVLNSFNEGWRISLTEKNPQGSPSKSHASTLCSRIQKHLKVNKWLLAGIRFTAACSPTGLVFKVKNREAVFKEKRGVWDPMLELTITSPYLIVDFEVQLSPYLKKGKGLEGEGPSYWLGTFVPVC